MFKKMFSIIVVILIFGISYLWAGDKSYVLMCKGGGGMQLKLGIARPRIKFQIGIKKKLAFISTLIIAKPGFKAANPGPGECVWIDRGMRKGEYIGTQIMGTQIILKIPDNLFNKWPYGYNISLPDGNVSGGDKKFMYLYKAIKERKSFQIHVTQVGKGVYKVTKIGP